MIVIIIILRSLCMSVGEYLDIIHCASESVSKEVLPWLKCAAERQVIHLNNVFSSKRFGRRMNFDQLTLACS